MHVLFNDIIQTGDAPDALKSPALSDVFNIGGTVNINLGGTRRINCIGIGNFNGTTLTITNGGNQVINFTGNGLYLLPRELNVSTLSFFANGNTIGRLGAGLAMRIGTSVRKEPSFNSTAEPRTTLSGQVVPGRGGHIFRSVSLDSRYKIDETMMNEIKEGYRYIGMGYPFFINLEDEAYKLPFDRLYAIDRNQMTMGFESGVKGFLYSRRWNFEERF